MTLVLIIEDNDRNLKLVRDILQAHGYATIEANDAETGLVMARERHPQLILMDIQLPGISGIEALRRLRADESTRSIPVVAVSASVMLQSRREISEAGFDGFLEKPISLRAFLDTVARALGRP